MNGFEKDLKAFEKGGKSNNDATTSNELKVKYGNVKSKYQNLMSLSSLYSKSFANLDNLFKVIEEFTSDLTIIESKLSNQSVIDSTEVSVLNKEIETINSLKHLLKQRESDLKTMRSYYEELKFAIEKVRLRSSDETSTEESRSLKELEERQIDDLKKLDALIKQLTDRWNSSFHLFKARRADLKKCLQAYEEYKKTLNNEKSKLIAMADTSAKGTMKQQEHIKVKFHWIRFLSS